MKVEVVVQVSYGRDDLMSQLKYTSSDGQVRGLPQDAEVDISNGHVVARFVENTLANSSPDQVESESVKKRLELRKRVEESRRARKELEGKYDGVSLRKAVGYSIGSGSVSDSVFVFEKMIDVRYPFTVREVMERTAIVAQRVRDALRLLKGAGAVKEISRVAALPVREKINLPEPHNRARYWQLTGKFLSNPDDVLVVVDPEGA